MRRIVLLPAVLAPASLSGCVYEEPHHYAAYSYAAPSYDYPPPLPGVVVYEDDESWYDQAGRFKNW